jgi:hypothetical protein
MDTNMKFRELDRDAFTGLTLIMDESDPPRYYVKNRHRRELVAIGDARSARLRFAAWLQHRLAPRTPPAAAVLPS